MLLILNKQHYQITCIIKFRNSKLSLAVQGFEVYLAIWCVCVQCFQMDHNSANHLSKQWAALLLGEEEDKVLDNNQEKVHARWFSLPQSLCHWFLTHK